MRKAAVALCVGLGLWCAATVRAADDVFFLRNGDRVSGRIVGSTGRNFTVLTAYGRLTIPRANVDRVKYADGREEVMGSGAPPARRAAGRGTAAGSGSAGPGANAARVVVVVTGHSFWYAWGEKQASDPRLRFEVSLDGQPAAVYLDGTLDPGEIRGARVNAFSFAPAEVSVQSGPRATALPPETRPGRIALRIDVPAAPAGERTLRVAYQVNAGTMAAPDWEELAAAQTGVSVRGGQTRSLRLHQDRGEMSYSGFPRKRMRDVETFTLELTPE